MANTKNQKGSRAAATRAKRNVDTAAGAAARQQQRAKRAIDTAQQKWDNASETMNKYVKENPMKAAAIAAGVGAAVGVAISSMVRRR